MIAQLGQTRKELAPERREGYVTELVAVGCSHHLLADVNRARKFLVHLPFERLSRSLATFHFAAWKLPHAGQGRSRSPLSAKNCAIANDHSANDLDLLANRHDFIMPGRSPEGWKGVGDAARFGRR